MKRKILFWQFLFVMVSVNVSMSQDSAVYIVDRMTEIKFDGIPDEPGWQMIHPVPVIQYEPNAGQPPSQKTEIRFAYDDVYFYASMMAFDTEPDGIRDNSLYRDRLSGSDHFELLLDTYNDNETALVFSTTPSGIRNDLAITNDGTGGTILQGGWINPDFNTFWDVKSVIKPEGWFTEMRIPFSSLRFQDNHGTVIMGLTAQRKIARHPERLVFPAVQPVTDWAFLRPSLAQKILLQGIKPTRRVYVTPYFLGGFSRWNEMNESRTAYFKDHKFEKNIGGEIKFSITNNLTMDLTLNTDFAQAEADDQMINLTRFNLFYPEKRQFFQERAGMYDFRIGGLSRLFYSRNIGLAPDGSPVPVYGGVRMVGRSQTFEYTLMDMQTQELDTLPSENFGVMRFRKQVINPYSYTGGMFTSRLGTNGTYNYAYGLDGIFRLFGDDYLTLQWTQSFDDDPEPIRPVQGINNSRYAFEWVRRRRNGLGYDFSMIYSGLNYNPGIGFVDRSDFKFGLSSLSYTWFYEDPSASFIWQKMEMTGFSYWGNMDNKIQSAEFGPEWSFTARNLAQGMAEVKGIYENLAEDFVLSEEVIIPPGEYHFYRIGGNYSMAYERLIRAGIGMETGTFYDGWKYTFSLSPSWYVSKHLELSLQYLLNHVDFSVRKQYLNVHIARLRMGTAVNTKLSTNALVQYNSGVQLFSANIRVRYNFREGNDLWIVFNEGLNTDRFGVAPELPLSDSESILIKYIHTFQF